MGNENSRLKGIVIDKTAVEANDFWALHNAEMPTTTNEEGRQYLSIFQEEPVVNGQLWVAQGPLQRAIKNFMIYRHPYILKYVATWEQGGQKHLATERVRPLTAVLAQQTDLQICLGLRTILCSLIFLTEKAMARHLNICTQSIYITDNGSWRLAGFEYVWKTKDVTKTLLDLAKAFRYKNAIDSEEDKDDHMGTIEQFAFGTLCEEILKKYTNVLQTQEATPYIQEFREYCTTHLKHKNAQMRPKLSAILLHPYFNHEFILIHSFLFELPLKSLHEKQDFFTGLIDRLRYFDEEVVCAQLARDLLSRMVLLDPTAQLCVTPCVLKTKSDHAAALFSPLIYKRHLLPHILKMFRLRDAQIRLILLEYFMEYVRLLNDQDIEEQILPHLLAGMNDTNDLLVAKTLRCMADLIPILGATAVVGGQRLRLFADGRPQAALSDSTTHWVEPRSITPVMSTSDTFDYMVSGSPNLDHVDLSSNSSASLPGMTTIDLDFATRLSPDGGEDIKSAATNDNVPRSEVKTTLNSSSSYSTTPLSIKSSKTAKENSPSNSSLKVDKIENATPKTVYQEFNTNIPHDEDDEWSDWETDGHSSAVNTGTITSSAQLLDQQNIRLETIIDQNIDADSTSSFATLPSQISLTDSYRTVPSNASSAQSLKPTKPVTVIDDLTAFDIQVQVVPTPQQEKSSEFDFFKDMEPVIKTNSNTIPLDVAKDEFVTNTLTTSKTNETKNGEAVRIDSRRFAAIPDATNSLIVTMDEGDGWSVSDEDDDNAMLCSS